VATSLLLDTPESVIRCLITYTDWYQPSTTSVLVVGTARRDRSVSDGFRDGLLESLDERTELGRRVRSLSPREREVLYLWYVRQLDVGAIARAARVSRRQCFRLRAKAVRKIVEMAQLD
jgi:DNA-directed RNA polymerase specialized sigma subunit